MGWPFDLRPPDGLIGSLPGLLGPAFLDGDRALAARRQAERLVDDQLGDGEAVMDFQEVEIVERESAVVEGLPPDQLRALEPRGVAPAHRQELVHVARRSEHHRLVVGQRGIEVGEHHRRRAVRDRRTVGPLQGTGDDGVLVRLGAAELEAEILLEMRERVDRAVGVVLGGDPGEHVCLVAVFLEVALGDAPENRREAPVLAAFFLDVARLDQHLAYGGAGKLRHLLDADHQNPARLPGRRWRSFPGGSRPIRWRRRSPPASTA